MPAPFLSVLTDDCIARGRDYNAGGARYNNTYIQGVGIGTHHRQPRGASTAWSFDHADRAGLLASWWRRSTPTSPASEPLRQRLLNRSPKYGNDDDRADALHGARLRELFARWTGGPNARGGRYRVEMLPTTCHVYFGR